MASDPFAITNLLDVQRSYAWDRYNKGAAWYANSPGSTRLTNSSDKPGYNGGFYGNSIGSTLNSGPRYARGTMMGNVPNAMMGNVPNAGIHPNFDRRLAGPNSELGAAEDMLKTIGNGINAVRGVVAVNTLEKHKQNLQAQTQQQLAANQRRVQSRAAATTRSTWPRPAAQAPQTRAINRAGAPAASPTPVTTTPVTTTPVTTTPTSPVTTPPASRAVQRGVVPTDWESTLKHLERLEGAPHQPVVASPTPTRRGMPVGKPAGPLVRAGQGTPPELNTPGGTGTVPTNWNNMSEHDVDPWAAYIGGPTTQELPVQPTGPSGPTMVGKVKGALQKLRGGNTPQDRSSDPTTEMKTTEQQDIKAAGKAAKRYNKEYGPF